MKGLDDKKMKAVLLAQGYLSKEDILKVEKENTSDSFVDGILSSGLITKDLLGQAFAESLKLSYADLNSIEPSREQVLKIPEAVAIKHRVVLFEDGDKKISITTDNPIVEGLTSELQNIFPNKKITLMYSIPEDIELNLMHYRKSLETRFEKIIESGKHIAPEIINNILEDAFIFNASDVHFEPQIDTIVVRFRIDGVLREAVRIPSEYYENILNRIKVQAHLRIDEHFSTQDGSIQHKSGDKSADLRVSIVPTIRGEKVVMRILAQYVQGLTLADIGLSSDDEAIFSEAAKKPFGMILVTGPTGSGKTTTLYSMLKMLNKPDVNITTIEDPVEYRTVGVNQIQVNPRTELTFAKGLRSIVRQDPDIILVGEIRDNETAEIAVNAALTGHLLLSTFHSNDAATAIPRLLDMGSEPFLLASTIEIIIAQRLVRKICDTCKYSEQVNLGDIKKISSGVEKHFSGKTATLYKGKGCNTCGNIGYKGRSAIFEFIKMTTEMQELILKNPSSQQIWELARKQGSRSLFEDGIEKVKNGVTTLEELLRIASPQHARSKKK